MVLALAGIALPSTALAAGVGRWLTWNAAARTASLTLVAGYDGSNNGFNFDGYGRGQLLVRVPLGWRVTVTCRNAGSMRHSCAIVRGAMTAVPAFPGATTPDPVLGLENGEDRAVHVHGVAGRHLPDRVPRAGARGGAHVGRARRRRRQASVDPDAAGLLASTRRMSSARKFGSSGAR